MESDASIPQVEPDLDFNEAGHPCDIPFKWRDSWRSHGEIVPSSEKEPESWNSAYNSQWYWRLLV